MYWPPFCTCQLERDLSVANVNNGEHLDSLNSGERVNSVKGGVGDIHLTWAQLTTRHGLTR